MRAQYSGAEPLMVRVTQLPGISHRTSPPRENGLLFKNCVSLSGLTCSHASAQTCTVSVPLMLLTWSSMRMDKPRNCSGEPMSRWSVAGVENTVASGMVAALGVVAAAV